MMNSIYFLIRENSQLTDILRAFTDLIGQLNEYSKSIPESEFPSSDITDMINTLNKMMLDFGDVIGRDIVNQAIAFLIKKEKESREVEESNQVEI